MLSSLFSRPFAPSGKTKSLIQQRPEFSTSQTNFAKQLQQNLNQDGLTNAQVRKGLEQEKAWADSYTKTPAFQNYYPGQRLPTQDQVDAQVNRINGWKATSRWINDIRASMDQK